MKSPQAQSVLAGVLIAASACTISPGAPVPGDWPSTESGPSACVTASALCGWYAVSDTINDTVEIRDIRGALLKRFTREELAAGLGWLTLSPDNDGPSAIAFTDSGRVLFIGVHDDEAAGDGFGGDAILRYDTVLDDLRLFTRTELSNTVAAGEHSGVSLVHFRGTLYAGTDGNGVQVHAAGKDAGFSILPQTVAVTGSCRGLAIDRDRDLLYAALENGLYRADIGAGAPQFSLVGMLESDARGVAVATTQGAFVAGDVFVGTASQTPDTVLRVPALQAIGLLPFAPVPYTDLPDPIMNLATTPCGRMLVATDAGPIVIADTSDNRLGFEDWLADEFVQVVAFGRGLIAPDGEPDGWVIDSDVIAGATRFHPASPDGAAWVVLLLLMDDHLNNTPDAQALVREILTRYAGLAADGISPERNADGIFKHWIDPMTGDTQSGWLDEYATLSTMKIVLAADRARRFYPGDPVIVAAADAITGGVSGWERYLQPGTDAMFFQGAESGGPTGGASSPFHEGIIFVEQASVLGDDRGAFARWLDRERWPTASFANGLSVTTNQPGGHLSAFVSLYSHLVQSPFRDDPAWREHIAHLLGSSGAWTDDAGARYMTVFSAGDSGPEFGGYNADSLSNHPGDITTFPSLMAFAADGQTAPAVGAYHAYRRGARQAFASGASILYRRSDEAVGFTPFGAGLPDVALGALGLAELLDPGSTQRVLAGAYGQRGCIADLAEPIGVLDLADINAFVLGFAGGDPISDLDANGLFDLGDISLFVDGFVAGCP